MVVGAAEAAMGRARADDVLRRYRSGLPPLLQAGGAAARHLEYRMAQFARQDHARILDHALQRRVVFQLAGIVVPDDAALAQLLDETAEQGLVEKFRRAQFVQ